MANPIIHTKPGEKIVTFFSTRNLYNVLPAAYNSLLAYNPDVHVYCFIEDDKLPYKTPPHVTCVNVTEQEFFPHDGPCYKTRYTYMILLKTALTKIFPDADRALILDVDTVTCDSLAPLWEWDLTHAYYAAVVEPEGSRLRQRPYANFGIVMLNLARLRNTGKDDLIISELNTTAYEFPEQDAFNKICMNRFDPLPPEYNVTKYTFDITGNPERTRVLHFAGLNDWTHFSIVQHWLKNTTPLPRYVVYAADHRVQDMMIAAAKSLLAHNKVDRIFLLVDNDAIAKDLPPVFQCINVSKQSVFPNDGPNIMTWYGTMTTLRAGLTRVLPSSVERVLWLDPDTIVSGDISDIWNYNIDHKYFAAVEEVRNHNHTQKPYFNAGVMYMNLKLMQESGIADKIIDDINTTKYEHLEQDALNFDCFLHILRLPSKYSDSYVSEPCEKPLIHHYLAKDKRNFYPAAEPYKNIPWSELKGVIEYEK